MAEDYGNGAVGIVNKALTAMGQDVTIAELDTASEDPVARKCAYLYTEARRRVLRDHSWGFAIREIGLHGSCRGGHGGRFPFAAPMPSDALRLLACVDERGERVPHVLQNGEIRAARPLAGVLYFEDVDDLEQWDSGAYQALLHRLCADLAKPVTGRINEAQLQEQKYQSVMEEAKEHDAANDCLDGVIWGRSSHLEDAMAGRHDLPSVPGAFDPSAAFAR